MPENQEFSVESGLFNAPAVATIPCQIENIDTYEEKIPDYQGRNFTYMPLPHDQLYFNTEEGWMRDFEPDQYLREDTHLMETLRRLQDYPFLLLDYYCSSNIVLYDSDVLFPKNIIENEYEDFNRVVSHSDAFGESKSDIVESDDFDYIWRYNSLLRVELDDEEVEELVEETTLLQLWENSDDNQLVREISEMLSESTDYDRFGIITIPDLNRRPMKEMIYRALSELEITISKNIEEEYEDSRQLFKPAHPATIGRWEKDQIKGLGLHIAEYMKLIELKQSLKMSDTDLVQRCGFDSKDDVDDLNSINQLRNKVMHSNRTLITNRRDIQELLENLARIEEIINSANSVKYW